MVTKNGIHPQKSFTIGTCFGPLHVHDVTRVSKNHAWIGSSQSYKIKVNDLNIVWFLRIWADTKSASVGPFDGHEVAESWSELQETHHAFAWKFIVVPKRYLHTGILGTCVTKSFCGWFWPFRGQPEIETSKNQWNLECGANMTKGWLSHWQNQCPLSAMQILHFFPPNAMLAMSGASAQPSDPLWAPSGQVFIHRHEPIPGLHEPWGLPGLEEDKTENLQDWKIKNLKTCTHLCEKRGGENR